MISFEESNLYRAIAELAYAVARSDGDLEEEERTVFVQKIAEHLGSSDWIAELRFDTIFMNIHPSVESAYKQAFSLIENNKKALTQVVVDKFKAIIKGVADVSGLTIEEEELYERFVQDLDDIFEESGN